MRMVLRSMVGSRAIIAVIALYALCLQALLGPLAPPLSPQLGGVICAHEASDVPAAPTPVCRHSCCVPVHAAPMLPAPVAPFAMVTWPIRASASPARPTMAIAHARAPPDRSVSPRGPPAA